MTKTKGSYSVIIRGCMDKFLKENNLVDMSDSDAFELFTLYLITKQMGISVESLSTSITDGSQDGGIDSIIVTVNDDSVDSLEDLANFEFRETTVTRFIISQSKTEPTFKESVIDKFISSCNALFPLSNSLSNLDRRFNDLILERTEILREAWRQTLFNRGKISVSVNYACLSEIVEVSNSFKSKVDQLSNDLQDIFSLDKVNIELYSSEELLHIYQKRIDDTRRLLFKEAPLSNVYGDVGIGYVGMVPINELKKFITSDEHQIVEELFESNVRHYQGNVDVNNKIKETLQGKRDRDFWWLNNGITIIAESCNQMGPTLVLTNPQIVNGLQTSFSIFQNFYEDSTDARSVLVKVIINTNKEIVDSIIASTNYQNMVAPGLLRATDDLQRAIEDYFYLKGYYYDRRKNYYRNRGKQSNRIFGIQFTAQAIKAIIGGEPNVARSNPSGLLKSETVYKTIFRKDDNFQGYLNCCLISSWVHAYVLRKKDTKLGTSLRNFMLHLSWIVAMQITKSTEVNCALIAQYSIESLDFNDYIEDALQILLQAVEAFREVQPNTDLINIAKSKEFVNSIKNLTALGLQEHA